MLQVVAAKVELFEVFRQQELFGPEMFDDVTRQIHFHNVRWQIRWNVVQICNDINATYIVYSFLKEAVKKGWNASNNGDRKKNYSAPKL